MSLQTPEAIKDRIERLEKVREMLLWRDNKTGLCELCNTVHVRAIDTNRMSEISRNEIPKPGIKPWPFWFPLTAEGKQKRLVLVDQVLAELRERNN